MVLLLAFQFGTFIVNLFFGAFIFFKNPRASTNRAFALFAAGVAGWNISIFLTIIRSSLLWGRLAFAFASVWTAGLLWFVHAFPQSSKHEKTWRNIGLLLGVIFFFIPASSLMIKSIAIVDGHITGELAPIPYLLWDAFFLISLIYVMVRSWVLSFKTKGLIRNQVQAITIGITFFLIPFLATNILLPLIWNDFRWNNLGPLFTLFLITFVTYAIIEYRFLEIRWVIKRSVDLVLLWIFAFVIMWGGAALLTRTFSVTAIQLITSFVIAAFFGPVAAFISRWSARLSSRGAYLFEDATSNISELVHHSLDLASLLRTTAEKLQAFFGFSRIALVVYGTEKKDAPFRFVVQGFKREIVRTGSIGASFCKESRQHVVEAAELQWQLVNNVHPKSARRDRELLSFMKSRGIAVMMPFCVGEEIVGMAFFGPRAESALLSDRDIALLRVIQGAVAPAISNGIRYAEMKQLYAQLFGLDKAKSEFIDVVAHHFRTPLTAILWGAELSLEEKNIPPKVREYVMQVQERASFLNVTLNRIFLLLDLENPKLVLEQKPLELGDVVRSITKEMQKISADKRLQLEQSLEPTTIQGDQEKVASIVRAIIENACLFSRVHGRVDITLSGERAKRRAVLHVVDRGIGIPEKDLPHIFDKFFRASNAQRMATDGVGVGLHIAKQLVEKHGGTIEVVSTLGKGTAVTVSFPLSGT